MNYIKLFLVIFVNVSYLNSYFACKGCMSLDEYNFEKIVRKFKVALVKFDFIFAYGQNQETFENLAEDLNNNDDILLAQVGVKTIEPKDNEKLAQKYGVEKDSFPAVLLFLEGTTDPVNFTDAFTLGNLKDFITDNADVYLSLPGCLEEFDELAEEFITAWNKEDKLEEAERLARGSSEKDKPTTAIYLNFMRRILKEGTNFIYKEHGQLHKNIKDRKLSDNRREELKQRLNILHSFLSVRDEL